MGDVVRANFNTTLDIEPNLILEGAHEADLADIVVIGWDKQGGFYLAASSGYRPDQLYLIEQAKIEILRELD